MGRMVRPAKTTDAEAVSTLVNGFAERGRMLHRSLESVYESLRDFIVADHPDGLAGCGALTVVGCDLGEIRSLAVVAERQGAGVGTRIVEESIRQGRTLGLKRIFVLTYEAEFFQRFGFARIDREALPAKVWGDCIHCNHADDCDETALILDLDGPDD